MYPEMIPTSSAEQVLQTLARFKEHAAGTAGGITRDVLIGAVPPVALRDWYLGISVLAGLMVFFASPGPERLQRLRNLVLTFDAAGLALFAVSGT